MSPVRYTAILAVIIVLQSQAATSTIDLPLLPPTIGVGTVCEGIICGRGRCVPANNNTFGFVCECDPGWRQALPQDYGFPRFMPCVIPNCTLNYECTNGYRAPPPPPPPPPPRENERGNPSYVDPCGLTDCGGGRCFRADTPLGRTCECEEGFLNLFNSTDFPCYRQCAFGQDCPALGFNTSTSVVDPNPFLVHNYSHAASLFERAELFALSIAIMTMVAPVLWQFI
ncbi:hypothetical protein ABFS83_14G019800 [Erythranthe nasuta]